MFGKQLFGMTCPLLLTSDGRKMGKTEKGAVYLAPERTSPYTFFQYFLNVADADVLNTLKFLSDVDKKTFDELEIASRENPQERQAQKTLAESLTKMVHGDDGLSSAKAASQVLFGAEIENLSDADLNAIFEDVPSQQLLREQLVAPGLLVIDALVHAGLAKSKGEARRLVDGGGIYVNNRRVEESDRKLLESDLASETVMVLRSGKKKYALLRFE